MAGQQSSPTTRRPSPQQPPNLLALLELIQSFFSTDDLEKAILALRAEEAGAELQARKALYGIIRFLFLDAGTKEAVTEFSKLTKAVAELGGRVNQLLSMISTEDLGAFLVPGSLKTRYEQDHPHEKKEVAKYVADKFFPDEKIYSFVQASVTSIHLGRELSKKTIRPGSLFYTNSIVFPLLLLQEHSHVSVYTHCGTEYDNLGGGWLPRHDDEQARDHLKYIFTREKDSLCDSFVTPIAVTTDKGELYVTRSELVKMIESLIKLSKGLVIMTFSSRVFPTREKANEAFMHSTLHPIPHPPKWTLSAGKQAQLVIAHGKTDGRTDQDRKNLIRDLQGKGFDVHWQDEQRKWHLAPASC